MEDLGSKHERNTAQSHRQIQSLEVLIQSLRRPVPKTRHILGAVLPNVTIQDDRASISVRDRVALIIENDSAFAGILLGQLRQRGFKGLIAQSGSNGFALARAFIPDVITLDIGLPDIDGFQLLEEFKRDPSTRNIPVHIMSADEYWQRALLELSGSVRIRDKNAPEHLQQELSVFLNQVEAKL